MRFENIETQTGRSEFLPMTKITVPKDKFNYVKENKENVKKLIKVLDKREKAGKSVDVEDSSQLSQTALVEVDVSGRYSFVAEGEEAQLDLVVARRTMKRKTPEPVSTSGPSQESPEATTRDPERQHSPEPPAHVLLPEKLEKLKEELYKSVLNLDLKQTPPLHIAEFLFEAHSIDVEEEAHITSLQEKGLLAHQTKVISDSSFSLRCFNTFKAEKSWFEKIRRETTETISLKNRYKSYQIDLWEAANVTSFQESHESFIASREDELLRLNSVWATLKKCSSRGKNLYEFVLGLNLGTKCN